MVISEHWPRPGIGSKIRLPSSHPTSLATLRGSGLGETPRVKACLWSGWMHVVVSSRVVFQHCIISFVIACFGFVVVPGVSSFCIRVTPFLFLLFVILFVLVLRHRPVTSG